ncbi:hypothetical protein ACFQX7_31380 [Luedemannella flava]
MSQPAARSAGVRPSATASTQAANRAAHSSRADVVSGAAAVVAGSPVSAGSGPRAGSGAGSGRLTGSGSSAAVVRSRAPTTTARRIASWVRGQPMPTRVSGSAAAATAPASAMPGVPLNAATMR